MEDALSFFQNLNALKVMLILYRDNPNVPFEKLRGEMGISENQLSDTLGKLITAELIHVREVDGIPLFTLSREARMSLNRLGARDKLQVTVAPV
ncbi:hypothetical protein HY995_00655 [Candidatus Micrarchaeota archaeon]|nr:hypothetical protein [Candidatus Micrarchaeota archaeon]MBI5176577.1 hypothetical protein [Candidatus Micrarchaeota archaeon]